MSVWGATLIVLVITAFLTDSPIMIAVGVIALVAGVISLFYLSRQGQGDWKSLIRYSKRLPEKYSGRVEEGVARLKTHHLTPGDLIGSVGTTLLTRTATITLIYACVRSLGENPIAFDRVPRLCRVVCRRTPGPVPLWNGADRSLTRDRASAWRCFS